MATSTGVGNYSWLPCDIRCVEQLTARTLRCACGVVYVRKFVEDVGKNCVAASLVWQYNPMALGFSGYNAEIPK
jgi:hypothetical protein